MREFTKHATSRSKRTSKSNRQAEAAEGYQIASDQVSVTPSRDHGSDRLRHITLSGVDNIWWELTTERDAVLLSFLLG